MLSLEPTCVFFAWLFSRRALKQYLEEHIYIFKRVCARLQRDEVPSDRRALIDSALSLQREKSPMCDESFESALKVFNTIDENGDQKISEGELGKAHALIMKYGNGMADLVNGEKIEGLSRNHDGEVDDYEWLAYMAAVEQTIGKREFIRSCEFCVDILNRSHDETGASVVAAGQVKDATVDELTACSAKLSSEEGIYICVCYSVTSDDLTGTVTQHESYN